MNRPLAATAPSSTGAAAALPASRSDTKLFDIGLAFLAIAAALTLVKPLAWLFRFVSRAYNEGWNAYWADAVTRGASLYVSADSLITNNYPPVSFLFGSALGRVIGDNIIAGRLISLTSFAVIIGATYLWLRATGSSRRIGLAGALILLVAFTAFGNNYVAMNDPQMLAHAFMLTALVVLWRFEFSRTAVIVAATLMLLGGFTKHLLIPLPVAVTAWMAVYCRRALGPWLACFVIGVPLGLWITLNHYPSFADGLLTARTYSMHAAVSATIHSTVRFLPLLILAALPRGPGKVPLRHFTFIYIALSLGIAALAAGGEGVTRNAFFDLLIGASLGATLGLETLKAREGKARAGGVVAFLGCGMTLYALASLPDTLRAVRNLDAAEQDTRATVRMIERLGSGRAACETLALCYWAREPFNVDFFTYGQKLKTGALSAADCSAALRRGDFPVLQLEPDREAMGSRLGPCSEDLFAYYRVAWRSRVAVLLVPK
jgi:hypothetical protein